MSDLLQYRDAVVEIKNTILQSRYQAARLANREQLLLYYGIGRYVSENTRTGRWGTGAIESISEQLQVELPGLRGYSASNIKNMRVFFEEWADYIEPNRRLSTGDLGAIDTFLRLGFTHHCEILAKCKTAEERWYYINRRPEYFVCV
jgi:hypothetical protein